MKVSLNTPRNSSDSANLRAHAFLHSCGLRERKKLSHSCEVVWKWLEEMQVPFRGFCCSVSLQWVCFPLQLMRSPPKGRISSGTWGWSFPLPEYFRPTRLHPKALFLF